MNTQDARNLITRYHTAVIEAEQAANAVLGAELDCEESTTHRRAADSRATAKRNQIEAKLMEALTS